MHDPAIMIRGFAGPTSKCRPSYFTDEAHKLEVIGDT